MKDPLKTGFAERLTAQQEAKKALLAKLKPKPMITAPVFESREEIRERELAAVRQARADAKEAARLEANATARPKGPLGPSPDQMWQARTPIAPRERERFAQVTDRCSINVETAQGWPHNNASQRAQDRDAISQALVELGHLTITRRSIPLPFPAKKAARIT